MIVTTNFTQDDIGRVLAFARDVQAQQSYVAVCTAAHERSKAEFETAAAERRLALAALDDQIRAAKARVTALETKAETQEQRAAKTEARLAEAQQAMDALRKKALGLSQPAPKVCRWAPEARSRARWPRRAGAGTDRLRPRAPATSSLRDVVT